MGYSEDLARKVEFGSAADKIDDVAELNVQAERNYKIRQNYINHNIFESKPDLE